MGRLREMLSEDLVTTHFRSFPQHVVLLSACSGTGSFELAARAMFDSLMDDGIDVTCLNFNSTSTLLNSCMTLQVIAIANYLSLISLTGE